jgi:alpha-2-macroglobulin
MGASARRPGTVPGYILAVLLFLALSSCGDSGFPRIEGLPEAEGGLQSEVLAVALAPSSLTEEGGIEYYEAAALKEEFFAPRESDEPLAVTAFGPEGELPVEMKRPDVFIAFNQPMTPLSKLGEAADRHSHMSIEPAVSGNYRWYGSRLLAFEPLEPLEGQRSYQVTLRKGLASLGGRKLEEELVFSFHTEYLDFAAVYAGTPERFGEIDQTDVSPEDARYISCEFTYPVDREYVALHLQVRAEGVEYPFSAKAPDGEMDEARRKRTIVLVLERLLPEDSDVRVILKAGASSAPEYLERPDDSVRSFHTLKPFTFRRLRTYSSTFPRSTEGDANPVFLEFSHPLADQDFSRLLSTSLTMDDPGPHLQLRDNMLKLNNLPVEYESEYSIRLEAGIRDIYGRNLQEPETLTVEVGPAARYYYFPDTGSRMLEAQFDKKIIYEYQNVFDGVWKIASIDDPYRSFSAEELEPYDFSAVPRNVKHYEVLDVSPYLNSDGFGTVGISWNFGLKKDGVRRSWEQNDLQLQVTDIGITTRAAFNKVLVWAASLSDGKPLAGADVELLRNQDVRLTGKTDGTGLAVFGLSENEYRTLFREGDYDRLRIRVSQGSDKAEFAPNSSHNHYHFGIYSARPPIRIEDERMEAFLFTDRGLYRKGETLTFRGIDRSWSAGEYSSYRGAYTIAVSEQRYRAEPFRELEGETSPSGGFYGSFELPENLEPGNFWIIYRRGSHEQRIPFTVAEFRRAAFEVRLSAPERTFFAGDSLGMQGSARFLSGGTLSGASFSALWTREPASYRPGGTLWKEYRFAPYRWGGQSVVSEQSGNLDGSGSTVLEQKTGTDQMPGIPYRYGAELAVQDESRQELASRASVLVHPAAFYIASRFTGGEKGWWSTFVKAGERIGVEAAFVSPDGALEEKTPASGAKAVLIKRSWQVSRQRGVYGRLNNRYDLVEEELETIDLSPENGRMRFDITAPQAGQYVLRISALDEEGRSALSEIDFYATGSDYVQWDQSDPEDIELVPDKEEYAPGETARLLVKSPLRSGNYLLTVEREGIIEERIIRLEGSAAAVEVPIREGYLPVVYVALSSFTRRGAAPTGYFDPDLGKPRGLFGMTALKVSPQSRSLLVTMSADRELYRPGDKGRVRVRVTSGGRPVEGAEVTFLAVDRGVVDLIDYHVPDPMEFFYADYKFPLGVEGADSRSLLINPVTYEVKDLQGGDGDEDGKLERRRDFSPLAVFEPFLVTGPDGSAEAVFTFPDTLTTYRSTAVAVKENRFGRGEAELKVQNPITMRSALPRKLRLRDTARAGVVLTNLSGLPRTLSVECRSVNRAIRVSGETVRRMTLDPGETREVPFLLLATEAGEGRLEFIMRTDILSEVLEESLTVERPLNTESFTVAGTLDAESSVQEGLVIPSSIAEGYGELSLRLSPNPLGNLSPVVERLVGTDYQILEGEMARVLPHILLGEKLEIFGSIYDAGSVSDFFRSLRSYQNRDGGFGYIPGSGRSSAYLSVRLAHYTALAAKRGLIGSGPDTARLLYYLGQLSNESPVSPHTRLYSLYVRTLLGESPEKELAGALAEGDENGLTGYGFLALSYLEIGGTARAAEIAARMEKFLKLGTRSLDPAETYERRFYFDSQLVQLSLLQMVLHGLGGKDDLLDKAGRTLISRQRYGRWGTLSDSEWVLISYAERFRSFIEEGGRVDAEVRLGETRLLSASSADPDPVSARLPLFSAPLAEQPRNTLLSLEFSRRGVGPLFYSGTITYALPTEVAPPRDEGFSVFSRLETLEGGQTARLTAGETYRMRVVVSSSRDRSMALLRVPVPSGCEIVDAALVTSRSYAEEGGSSGRSFERETIYGETGEFADEGYYYPDAGYFRSLAPERKILDNETRYYFRHFYAGKENLEFLVRAVNPGIYPTPAAKIQGIYEEEVFGRGAGRLVIIE